jgi:inorganic pyrophosphatase
MPLGSSFPYDFGFRPSTAGDDGDPLDVLLLMEEPAFPGCVVHARLLGVIEADQTQDGKKLRNDRIIAVATECNTYGKIESLNNLGASMLGQIEHFLVSYNEMRGKRFHPLGRFGTRRAERLIRKGMERFGNR